MNEQPSSGNFDGATADSQKAHLDVNSPPSSAFATLTWSTPFGVRGSLTIDQDGRPKIDIEASTLDSRNARSNDAVEELASLNAASTPPVTIDNYRAAQLYLDLMKNCLTRLIFSESGPPIHPDYPEFDETSRREGRDWPADAETMIGIRRLNNIQQCIEDVLRRRVPGDLIEAGVWRGGATIFMRAVLEAYGDTDRKVWVADSFEGIPSPDDNEYVEDSRTNLWQFKQLAVSLDDVRANFARYGFLDDRVRFVEGWFKDSLPGAPVESLALMRLDGDLYGSTMDSMVALYPKLSVGGYVIIDDYNLLPPCRKAVDDYRRDNGISEPIQKIDWNGSFWRRER